MYMVHDISVYVDFTRDILVSVMGPRVGPVISNLDIGIRCECLLI